MCSFQLPKEVSQFLDTLNITKRDVYSLKVSGNITSQLMHPFSDNHRSNHRYIRITVIIKVFLNTNYCSWRYSKRIQTHTHTEAPAHMRILTIQNLIYTQLKGQQRHEAEENITVEWKTWQVYCLGKRSVLRFDLKESREGFCQRKWKVILCSGAKTKKGTGTSCGKSGTRNLEAESIRSRAESRGGCVKLKTVTGICLIIIAVPWEF